jgi:hypothetical protein
VEVILNCSVGCSGNQCLDRPTDAVSDMCRTVGISGADSGLRTGNHLGSTESHVRLLMFFKAPVAEIVNCSSS